MMGSKGDSSPQATALAALIAAMPPQVSALAMLGELIALVQASDHLMPAAIKDLRAAESAAREAYQQVEHTVEKITEAQAALAERSAELDKRDAALAGREGVLAQDRAAIEKQQASSDNQAAELAARKRELDEYSERLALDDAKIEHARLQLEDEHQAKCAALTAETDRQRRENDAAIQAARDKADGELREMRTIAQAEITAKQNELQRREATVIGREEELNRERARMRELLQE